METVKGVDVSKWNGKINFKRLKEAGYDFAMLRLGYGSNDPKQDDELFARNVAECEKYGIDWGAYLYSYALNVQDAESEAEHAIRILKEYKPTYPIAFDMEDADGYKFKKGMPSNEVLVDICETFLSRLEEEGYYVCLYASKSWLMNQLLSRRLNKFDKWVAQWSDECTYNQPYGIWQYTDKAKLPGSTSNNYFDANISYKEYPEIIKSNGLNGWAKKETDKKYIYHEVSKGDTLSEIARKYDTTYQKLAEINNIKNPNLIFVGQKILIKVK